MMSRGLCGIVTMGGVLAALLVAESWSQTTGAGARLKSATTAREEPKAASGRSKSESADEAAIRANVEAFVRGYNSHDAAAVAKLFAPQAKIVTEGGDVVDGHEAIADLFSGHFADEPDTHLELAITAIKFIGSDLAVETGTTTTVAVRGDTPQHGRYTVLHVKKDGQWLMGLVQDEAVAAVSNHDRLRPLEWLVGEWVDESRAGRVKTSCRWSDDGNFLLQEMQVQIAGVSAMRVTQRIGWDPLAKRIRSWVFDSEGGFGEGHWTPTSDGWVIKSSAVQSDGTTASATNLLAPLSRDAYVWRSVDRVMGDAVAPAIEVRVVRQPPEPAR